MKQKYTYTGGLVIRGLFICGFAYSHLKNDLKWQFFCQKWTFYMQIQDSWYKMTERIYSEYQGKLVQQYGL